MTDKAGQDTEEELGFLVLSTREPPASGVNDYIVITAAITAAVAGIVFAVGLLAGWRITVYGTALAVGLLALAVAVRRYFTDRYPDVEGAEEREPGLARADDTPISAVSAIPRRTMLGRILAGAAAIFGLAIVAPPVASLGPAPGRTLGRTAWSEGTRLVGDDGVPVTLDRVAVGGFANVWPEGAVGQELSAAILLRLPQPPEPPTNLDWVVADNIVVYSKVCTHAGCPVSLFRERDRALFCPCHQSTFDANRGAVPTFGPTARALPQLPLGMDDEGVLIALGDFTEQVGPAYG